MLNPVERVEAAILASFDKDWEPRAESIAEQLVDEDVSSGEYEGCSTELEMAFQEYETLAERALA